ncbi:MAG: hypothetical protein HKN23_21010 [Verrucomicrobiales bacterium]|nr:hypothetical protein [Verrucomicrobiales bacterium]
MNQPCWIVFAVLAVSVSGRAGQNLFLEPMPPEQQADAIEKTGTGPIAIEPKFRTLPANFLKFYLHFPEKMERGSAFEHLSLFEISEDGKTMKRVLDPFREVELWDETQKRMTLWFHPGRQKPGVNLNVEFGPILETGKWYRLDISEQWKTESGERLEGGSAMVFRAGAKDTWQPKPSRWQFEGAKLIPLGSWNPRIEEQLDPVSLRTSLKIRSADGEEFQPRVSGDLVLQEPDGKSLSPGEYELVVSPKLEDLAGNSIARPFNVDLEKNPNFKPRTEPVVVQFEIP